MRVHQSLVIGAVVLTGFFTLATFRAHPATKPAQKVESLPLCNKCQEPAVFSKSGIGTANAVAKARVTYQGAKDYCAAYSMEDHPDCDKEAKETLKEEAGKIYTATADCVHGKLTDANGESFLYAGLWPKTGNRFQDWYLAGKTRWRWGSGSDADTGKIVGEDGPTNAFMVSATAAILCPNGVGPAQKH
jgi:hypothetical protein